MEHIRMVRILIEAGMSKDKAIGYVCNTYKVDSTLLALVFDRD